MSPRLLLLVLLLTTSSLNAQPVDTSRPPSWPQSFELQGAEPAAFGLAVTQPGNVSVEVRTGAPVVVSLLAPGLAPVEQAGSGNVRLNRTLSAQEVQQNPFWTVLIRLANPSSPIPGSRAQGSVNVTYPPIDEQRLQAALGVQRSAVQREAAQRNAQALRTDGAAAQLQAQFNEGKRRFDAEQQQQRAARLARSQQLIDGMKQRQKLTAQPDVGSTPTPAPGEGTTANDQVKTRGLLQPGNRIVRLPTQPAPAPPALASLSVAQGQPGDPVIISGSSLGGAPGEVHFLLGPNRDEKATGQLLWYDNQILAYVPDLSGVLATNGHLYIVRQDGVRSGILPFRFEPALEYRQIGRTADVIVGSPGSGHANGRDILHTNANPFWGFKGNDELFTNTRLQNGWVLDNAFVTMYSQRRAGAYIQEMKTGTDWPYVNVRWWIDPCFGQSESIVSYGSMITIRGPRGVKDGLVMK